MTEGKKTSTPMRLGLVLAAVVLGFFAAWIALDASQTSGRYWPIHVVSGPIFSLADSFAAEIHGAVLTFLGTGLLFGFYTWCATKFRSWALMVVLALVHLGLAAGGVAMATQSS
jgi:hypothetical protein